MMPLLKKLVTRCQSALIFAHGEWSHVSAAWRTPGLLAWLFHETRHPRATDSWNGAREAACSCVASSSSASV